MNPRSRINWPKAIAWVVMLLAFVALWGGLAVAIAKAAPPKEPRAPIYHEISAQEEFDRTAAWLSRVLRADIPSRPIEVTEDLHFPVNEAEFYPSGLIKARPAVETALAFREGVTIRGKVYAPGPHIVVHESLHREDTSACWWPAAGAMNVEEGIVDALAADLVPAWGWHFWRERLFVFPRYPVEVAAIRAASARATGSKTWRERGARSWRRALWAASCEGRAAMLAGVR